MKNYARWPGKKSRRNFRSGLDAESENARIQGRNANIQPGSSFQEPVKDTGFKGMRR